MSLSSNQNGGSMEHQMLDDEKEYAEENDEKQESDLKVIL
jgi:hypothetical protein